MPRILLLIVLLWIIYVLIKYFIKKAQSANEEAKDGSHAEKVIACVKCGMHVPESETHIIDGKVYCNNPNCNN
ncbi:MAG TPA: PP0621 family protein [Methylophilaceae bacterium]|nr:PP0621 family protein [Methylophilaceae bacterium]